MSHEPIRVDGNAIMNVVTPLQDRAAGLLERWAEAAEGYWHGVDGDASMGCYGPGYLTWGVQSNWNYAGAMATLSDRETTRDHGKWRDRAAALRFALATHVTGGRPGNDGRLWGTSWISVLGIERAMHGLTRIEKLLSPTECEAFQRLLVREADWLRFHVERCGVKGVVAGLWALDGSNCPESNVWSGCALSRRRESGPR